MDRALFSLGAAFLQGLGILPLRPRSILALPSYIRERRRFLLQGQGREKEWPIKLIPMLSDRYLESGELPKHYFIQDLIVARRIYELAPNRHLDIGSRLDGFVSHLASFREVDVMDIRPLSRSIPQINYVHGNLMDSSSTMESPYDSVSCLHTIEHLGLGRYGDPIDYEGYIKGLRTLSKLVEPEGRLHLSFPIGPQRVIFNMHRIFSVKTVLDELKKEFKIARFSYLDDNDVAHIDVNPSQKEIDDELGCHYGLAILELIKNN